MTLGAFGREHGQSVPRGVRSLTFFLKRSPELIEDNCGKRFIRRSVCVPFPTPGAPTRMILAARERAIVCMVQGNKRINSSRKYVHKVEAVEWRPTGAREVMGLLEEGHTGREVGGEDGGCGLEAQQGGGIPTDVGRGGRVRQGTALLLLATEARYRHGKEPAGSSTQLACAGRATTATSATPPRRHADGRCWPAGCMMQGAGFTCRASSMRFWPCEETRCAAGLGGTRPSFTDADRRRMFLALRQALATLFLNSCTTRQLSTPTTQHPSHH
jgi:hypothetical protein